MRLYIIRHADPDYRRKTITAAGHLEAQALARRLSGEKLERIYTSPLGRAQDTAQYTADKLGLTAEIRPWLTELNQLRTTSAGPCPDMMAWDIHGRILREGYAASDKTKTDTGDSYQILEESQFADIIKQVAADSDAFLGELGYERQGNTYKCIKPNSMRIAVFCHGGLGLSWLAHLLNIPTELMWSGFWLPPSSVTTVLMDQREHDYATPRCLCVGDTSHLHAEGLPILPAGIKANFV